MVKTYVKVPVAVQAVQWTGENLDEVIEFGQGQIYIASWIMHRVKDLGFFKDNTWVTIFEDDYVIRRADDKLDTCRPDIFKKTYKLKENNNGKEI